MSRAFPWIALVAALVVAWLPLLPPYPIAGQSALSDWARAEALHAAVSGGDLFPAWLPDLYDRHGTPLPLFYAPLSYQLIELWRVVTHDLGAAIKLAFLTFWILGAAGAAVAARALFGAGAGAPAAAAFALSPYLLADLYVRAGIAEFAALALVPWALAALVSPGRGATIGGVVAVAALVLTHNLTALLAVPVLLLFGLTGSARERWRALGLVSAGLALSLFFWLPALVEKELLWAEESLTRGFFDFARHFVAPEKLLPFRTSFEFTVGPNEGAPFRFGELLWAGLLVAPLLTFSAPSLEPQRRRRVRALALGVLVALLMTTKLSSLLWYQLPLLRFVQFPFRFFLLATVLAAPLVGFLVTRVPERYRGLAAAGAVAMALLVAQPLLEVRYLFLDRATASPRPVKSALLDAALAEPALATPSEILTLDRLRRAHASGSAGHDYLPRTVTALPDGPETAAARALSSGIEVLSSGWGYPEVRAEIRVDAPGELLLHQFHFPGWRVEVDGHPRDIRPEPGRGRIVVPVAPGDRFVHARFGATPLRRGAAIASVLAAFAMAGALGVALLASRRFKRQGSAGSTVSTVSTDSEGSSDR